MNRRHDYRDQTLARATVASQKRRYRARTGSGYGYRFWTDEEKAAVLAHSVPDRDLAKTLGRSVQAIHAKRNALGEPETVKAA